MPTSDFHAQSAAPIFIGVSAIIYSVFTPTFIVIFLCAVMGSGIGMAFLPAPSPIKSRIDLLLRFIGNSAYILISSIVIMFAMHYLKKYLGDGTDYPLAFFSAMFFMLFRDNLILALGKLLSRKIDGV